VSIIDLRFRWFTSNVDVHLLCCTAKTLCITVDLFAGSDALMIGNIRYNKVSTIIPALKEKLITWRSTDIVNDTFVKIAENNVLGIAIVDNQVLVDSLIIQDLRILGPDFQHFNLLYGSVAPFNQFCRKEEANPNHTHHCAGNGCN